MNELETEVIKAKDENCMILLQTDANAKIGKQYLKKDPNDISSNGKLLIGLVERQ